jgi:hypothetical protein
VEHQRSEPARYSSPAIASQYLTHRPRGRHGAQMARVNALAVAALVVIAGMTVGALKGNLAVAIVLWLLILVCLVMRIRRALQRP